MAGLAAGLQLLGTPWSEVASVQQQASAAHNSDLVLDSSMRGVVYHLLPQGLGQLMACSVEAAQHQQMAHGHHSSSSRISR
jgi:hypothetical protein